MGKKNLIALLSKKNVIILSVIVLGLAGVFYYVGTNEMPSDISEEEQDFGDEEELAAGFGQGIERNSNLAGNYQMV